MEEKDKNVEEIEMDLNLDSKKTSSKINSRNLDKEILKKYCMGKLTKDELSRMSKSARKTCERKLKLLKKISKRIEFETDTTNIPKEEPKKKEIVYSEESLKHKHDLEIDID